MGTPNDGRKLGLLTIVGVLGVLATGCGHPPRGRPGAVDVIVSVPDGVAVEVFTFSLSGNGITPLAGGAHASRPQPQFEKLINGAAAGEYEIDVGARSLDGRLMCKAGAPVSVLAGAVSRVHLALTCLGANEGNVVIDVNVVGVPCTATEVADYSVSPLSASVGDSITVTVTPSEPDAGGITFAWSAPTGAFGNPSSPKTSYQCAAAGEITLTLHITAGACAQDEHITVECVAHARDPADD